MSSVVDQVRERTDIVRLIQGYLKLQKAGVNFKARCPFHNEKTPSFFISPDRQTFKCFGCGEGGSAFDFLMKIDGLEFSEALKILANQAGVELKNFNKEFETQKTRLYEICDIATNFFQKQLFASKTGLEALSYLKKRAIKDASISRWKLGYAPNTWTSLKDFLTHHGFREDEISTAGLIVNSSQFKSSYDRFRGRIMFPIFNINGQIVGFTGRVFSGEKTSSSGDVEVAKYINSPQTPIYDKSRILFGLNFAKQSFRQFDRCIVVEGNMDVILSHQAGVSQVIASSGTALTDEHLKILKRYTENIDLCFDVDLAGGNATQRGIDLALAKGFNVGVVKIPKGNQENPIKDPADFIVLHGNSAWLEEVQKSRCSIIQYKLDDALEKNNHTSAEGKKKIVSSILPTLALVENPVETAHWISILSAKLSVAERIFQESLTLFKKKNASSVQELTPEYFSPNTQEQTFRKILEESLLVLCFKLQLSLPFLDYSFANPIFASIYQKISQDQTTITSIPEIFDASLLSEYNILVIKSQEMWQEIEVPVLIKELERISTLLKKETAREELTIIKAKLDANRSLPQEQIASYLSRVRELSKHLL